MNVTDHSIWERERVSGPLLVGLPNGLPYLGAVCFIAQDGQPLACYRISQPATLGKLYEFNEAHGTYEHGLTVSYEEGYDPQDCFQPDEQVKPWRVYGKIYKYIPYTRDTNTYYEELRAVMAAAGVTDPDRLPKETEPYERGRGDRRLKRAKHKPADRGAAEGSVPELGGE